MKYFPSFQMVSVIVLGSLGYCHFFKITAFTACQLRESVVWGTKVKQYIQVAMEPSEGVIVRNFKEKIIFPEHQ
jgi:hypothetical protein